MPDSIYANSGLSSAGLTAFKTCRSSRWKWATRVSIGLGLATVLCALRGFAYNARTLVFVLWERGDEFARDHELVHFHAAFYAMWAISCTCYAALLWGGWRLIAGRSANWLILVWTFEVAYFLLIGASWLIPGVGPDIAAATGLANGGLMAQLTLLLPVWGSLVIVWSFLVRRSERALTAP